MRRRELVGLVVERFLGHADGLAAMRLDGLAPFFGLFAQFILRDDLVDEADLDSFGGGERAGQENHLAGQPLTDHARDVLRRTDGRASADLGAGLAEHGVVGRRRKHR